jgi:hypothetical protein
MCAPLCDALTGGVDAAERLADLVLSLTPTRETAA